VATYTPQGIDFAESAPVVFEASAVVAATRDEVWTVLCDHERWPEWMGSLRRVRPTSTPASGVGSTREVVLSGGLAFQEEFIAWDEPEVWAFTGLEGPPLAQSLVERVTLVARGEDRTEVTYRMAIEPRRGFGLLVRAGRIGVERNLAQALQNLDAATAARR
jgi:uncharacterized protein YndB with AHSA1/START domain